MFRWALTYQLILAVAVGPLLCCCTAGRLAASPARQTSPATPQSAAPKARIASSCCAHKHQPTTSNQARGHDHKQTPLKPAEKCPCKGDSGKADKIQTEVTSADAWTLLRALSSHSVVPFELVDGTSRPIVFEQVAASCRGPNASLPSTADLLFSHHKLRC